MRPVHKQKGNLQGSTDSNGTIGRYDTLLNYPFHSIICISFLDSYYFNPFFFAELLLGRYYVVVCSGFPCLIFSVNLLRTFVMVYTDTCVDSSNL